MQIATVLVRIVHPTRTVRRAPGNRQPAAWVAALGAFLWLSGCARTSSVGEPSMPAVASIQPPAVTADTSIPKRDMLLVNESEYQGWRYYHIYCARCHGQDALGSANAPDLRHSVSPEGGIARDSFLVIVRDGSTENVEMRGFADLLEDERIGHLYLYIKARSEERLAAGRPHRERASP